MFSVNKNKSFTIIELLIVIAIIGLLSSIFFTTMKGAKARANDAKRKQELDSIRKALELYWQEYEHYPPESLCTDSSVGCTSCGCANDNFPNGKDWDANSDLRILVNEGFLGAVPVDPINDSSYYYWYEPDGSGQGNPPCQVNTCRWTLCAKKLETTGSQYCIYSLNKE